MSFSWQDNSESVVFHLALRCYLAPPTSIIETLKFFNDFIDLVRNSSTSNIEELSIDRWEDELGRLRMWAANIGAHRIGQSSLNYCLRDASHIREQVLKLLKIVRRRLKNAQELLNEDSECSSNDSSDGEDSNPNEPSKMVQMQNSVATMISCLFQMSMLVRNPTKHDTRREPSRLETSAFAFYDFNHVRKKFPKANEVLISRLETAITQRREYLSYRERHAAKLKQGLSDKPSGADIATIGYVFSELQLLFSWWFPLSRLETRLQSPLLIRHVLPTQRFPKDGKTDSQNVTRGLFHTIATDPQQRNIDFDDRASDSGVFQPSYAPTLRGGGDITIPPAPEASQNGEPFECPFCYYIITLDGGHSWAKHVFQDLQPYVCLEIDCTTPYKMYPMPWQARAHFF